MGPGKQLLARSTIWLGRWVILAALLHFASLPVFAQTEAPAGPDGTDDWEMIVPRTLDLYLRTGPVFPLGGSFLGDGLEPGWAVEAGLRFPLFTVPARLGPMAFFGEFGGAYAGNCRNGAPLITSGAFYAPFDNHVHDLANFYETRITDLQRYSFNASLGSYLYPLALNRRDDRNVFFSGRLGGRIGGADGAFTQTPTATLTALESAHAEHGHDPAFYDYTSYFRKPAFLAGLFASVGMGVTYQDLQLGRFSLGNVTLGAELEFSHDWIQVGDFSSPTQGLGTITPLLTVLFNF